VRLILRLCVGLCLGLSFFTAMAQAWITSQIGNLSNHCDYPEDCLTRWLPREFAVAQYLWMVTLGLGVVALVASLLSRRSVLEMVVDIVILGVALTAAFYSYWLTPMAQTRLGTPITDHLVQGNPHFFAGSGFSDLAQLMAISAVFFLGQLARFLMMAPAPSSTPTTSYQSARDHRHDVLKHLLLGR
jgi:hypothetical protein